MKDLRRLVVVLVIGSFSVAALMGIAALLGAGDFGETQGRVLLTTVVVGVESTVVLCLLTLAGHRFAPLGLAGGAASVVATASALVLTWGDLLDGEGGTGLLKTFGVSAIIAGTCAQLALLIALVVRPGGPGRPGRPGLNGLLAGTVAAAAIVAAMAIAPIVAEADPGGDYWRVFGITAILDVLGTVVVIALGAFGRVRDAATRPVGSPATTGPIVLTPAQAERVVALAAARDTTPEAVITAALDRYLP